MKKEAFIHYSFLISFFLLISIVKGWFSLLYWPFWVGGIIGNILVDVDHFIYIYFLRPQELTSRRVGYMFGKRNVRGSLNLLAETRQERKDLIFHTVFFQLIFLVLTFLVVTSTGSILGRGIVLAFSLHLLVDQAIDLMEIGNLNTWLKFLPIRLDEDKHAVYWVGVLLLLLLFGFLL